MLVGLLLPAPAGAAGYVVFGSSNPGVNTYLMRDDGTGLRELVGGESPAFSPNGKRVVYVGDEGDLWLMGADGTGKTRLTHDDPTDPNRAQLWYDEPVFLTEDTIVYSHVSTDGGYRRIWKMSLTTGERVQLTHGDSSWDIQPAASPDGQEIAFVRWGGRDEADPYAKSTIYKIKADGSGLRRLSYSDGTMYDGAFDPSFSPKGTRIIFTRVPDAGGCCGHAGGDVWVTSADGSDPRPVALGKHARHPQFSPFETRVMFTAPAPGHSQYGWRSLYTADADGSNPRQMQTIDPYGNEIYVGRFDWHKKPPPDRDNDGIADDDDACPDLAGTASNGCPDGDGDSVPDNQDVCPRDPGPKPSGCPDSDGDGLVDNEDACPSQAGPRPSGCPERDSDGDGVLDRSDACPNMSGEGPDGCPGDADRDGVPDARDNCPIDRNPDQADRDRDGAGNACDASSSKPKRPRNGRREKGRRKKKSSREKVVPVKSKIALELSHDRLQLEVAGQFKRLAHDTAEKCAAEWILFIPKTVTEFAWNVFQFGLGQVIGKGATGVCGVSKQAAGTAIALYAMYLKHEPTTIVASLDEIKRSRPLPVLCRARVVLATRHASRMTFDVRYWKLPYMKKCGDVLLG